MGHHWIQAPHIEEPIIYIEKTFHAMHRKPIVSQKSIKKRFYSVIFVSPGIENY